MAMARVFALLFVIGLTVASLAPLPAAAQSGRGPRPFISEVATIAIRPGATIRAVYWRTLPPAGDVGVAVLLFAGGTGQLRITPSGIVGGFTQNFLVRSREMFIDRGIDFVGLVDAPLDRPQGMNATFRLSQSHADDIGKVVDDIRARSGMPVWLIGTSSGTLSAANVAVRLSGTSSQVDGLVLTSPMSALDTRGRCGKTVFDAGLANFRKPVLVISHADDACICTPASKARAIVTAAEGSPRKEMKIVSGGAPPASAACEARAQHGFFGLEDEVVGLVVDWIRASR